MNDPHVLLNISLQAKNISVHGKLSVASKVYYRLFTENKGVRGWLRDRFYFKDKNGAFRSRDKNQLSSFNDEPTTIYEKTGEEIWYSADKLHRLHDKPACIYRNDIRGYVELYYWKGKLHRENDQPAWVNGNGTKQWYYHGKLHRENNLPAEIYKHATFYYWWGKRHRTDGPAVVDLSEGQIEYWIHGKKHREGDLPAVRRTYIIEWWINGERARSNDKPCFISRNGSNVKLEWWQNKKLHRAHGPAKIELSLSNHYITYWDFKEGRKFFRRNPHDLKTLYTLSTKLYEQEKIHFFEDQ